MFKKFRENKLLKSKDIDNPSTNEQKAYIKSLMQGQKLHLIVLDPLWYEIKPMIQTKELLDKEKQLNELIKEQGKLTTDIKEYEKVKQNLLQNVLQLSEEVQGEPHGSKMRQLEKVRQTVLKTKEIIEQSEKRLEEVDILIKGTNKEIIEEVVEIGYEQMQTYHLQKEKLEKEIDELRKQVVAKTEEKKAYDKKFGMTYNYLHKIIGYKYIDKVDKKLGEKNT